MEIKARNVNTAIQTAITHIWTADSPDESRNGPVLVAPAPVLTCYKHPTERVLFSVKRDANPFFHLMEALWMLAGRNDVNFPSLYNSRIESYSDDGHVFWGAYGCRWRKWFGYDQLTFIIDELRKNPHSRRCVLTMWDAQSEEDDSDLHVAIAGGKDVPCNTHAYFDLRGGALNMTVLCRSNDAIWGCYGANVVHFSFLLEYMAAFLNAPVGVYRHFSHNLHIYKNVPNFENMVPGIDVRDLYAEKDLKPQPLVDPAMTQGDFDEEVQTFVAFPFSANLKSQFLMHTARNAAIAYSRHKKRDQHGALYAAKDIASPDWQIACTEWLERRYAAG